MFRVSKRDFIAAFALHKDTARPIAKVTPSVPSPFEATRVYWSRATSSPGGDKSGYLVEVRRDCAGICKQTVDRDKRRKRRKYRKKAVEGHARGERKYSVVRNVSVDAQQNVFPAACGNFRGGARVPAPSGFERLARRAVAAVPRSKSPCPRMAGFFSFTVRHQVRHRNSGGERCKRLSAEARPLTSFVLVVGIAGVAFRQIAPVNAARRFSFLGRGWPSASRMSRS